jgi:hypothetical protein
MPHQYIGVEVLSMTAQQRQTLIDALRALVPERDEQPAWRVHLRLRLDNQAAIVEARWKDADVTDASIRRYLAQAFGVAEGTVTSAATTNAYGRVLTLTYNSVQRVRFILFGGAGASWEQSWQAALAYLAANIAQWETA